MPVQRRFWRPTWVEIDPAAFRANLALLSARLSPNARILAVLKANAYGHGAVDLSKEAASVPSSRLWGFGVSSVEEGLSLRGAGVKLPILILGSLYPFESFEEALRNGLTPTIASRAAAKAVGQAAVRAGGRTAVHVKVDTGMGRIGVSPDRAGEVLDEIAADSSLQLEGLYTHFYQAENRETTLHQVSLFRKAADAARARGAAPLLHAANSAAAFLWPETHFDMVRAGLALYGIAPSIAASAGDLRPVLSWKTRIVYLKKVPAGTSISYAATFRTERPAVVATLPVGYADGYARRLGNRASVLVRGRRCPVLGRVTMDQIMVDVTGAPEADVGDEAVLIGAQGGERITAEELAGWADTIPYEILCGISARVPRIFGGAI